MAALRDHEKEAAKAQRDAMESWCNAHALWKGERDRILGEARKGKGEKRAAAQANLESLGPEPAAPPSADRTVTEPTFEGLTKLFAHGQPSLGLFSDEGGQFLGGHAMNSENRQKTLAAFNDLWQGNPIRRTRSGDGHATLYGRRLAVHLMVQPTVARGFMADPLAADTGFLPRFLMCEPPSAIGTRMQANARRDDMALAGFAGRLRDILDTPLPMDPDTRALQPRTIGLVASVAAPPHPKPVFRVAEVASVATPQPNAKPDEPAPAAYGKTPGGRLLTWTGRVVSLDEWRRLMKWERYGPSGRRWNGITRRWETQT